MNCGRARKRGGKWRICPTAAFEEKKAKAKRLPSFRARGTLFEFVFRALFCSQKICFVLEPMCEIEKANKGGERVSESERGGTQCSSHFG